MTPEGRVKHAINKLLDQYVHYRFDPVQMGYGKKTLDKLICLSGLFLAVEAKALGEKPTALQLASIRDITAAGGIVFVIDGDLTALREFLEKHGTRTSQPETPRRGSALLTGREEPIPSRKGARARGR
jgi:hypothetical protein